MIDPDSQDATNSAADLEVTVRHLREENAKLIQLLRSQGLLPDLSSSQAGKSSDSHSSTHHSQQASESSSITFDHSEITCTSNSTNTTNQVHHQHVNNQGSINQQNYGGQTVHGNQSNVTPNFNTVIQTATQPFVQNNSNTLVQNNTNLIQPINLVNFNNVSLDSIQSFFASQNNVVYLPPSSTTTTTTTTTTSSNSILSTDASQTSSRPEPALLHLNQELVPVIPKICREHYESITRQSSANAHSDTSNLLDPDYPDPKQKNQRSIRPRPSGRANASRAKNKAPVLASSSPGPTRLRTRKKKSSPSPSPLSLPDVPPTVTSKQRKPTKRNLKSHLPPPSQIENIGQDSAFAETISGFFENFNQELLESNLLPRSETPTITSGNLFLPDENTSIATPNSNNNPRSLDNIDLRHLVNGAIHSTTTTASSMPTLEEFHDRLEPQTHVVNSEFTVEHEPIASFMSEEDMRLVEMNFDENTFLKQFDLEDANIKLSVHSDQNIFASLLTHGSVELLATQKAVAAMHLTESTIQVNNETTETGFSSAALINGNVFTTVVPLGLQTLVTAVNPPLVFLPEEGIQLTARHIEPQQVATYESTAYQDILDDLVMVTDQDVLSHAQAAAASDPSIVSTEFSFALIEATNEIIKETQIELLNDTTDALNQLQYFYPPSQQPPIAVLDESLLAVQTPSDQVTTEVINDVIPPKSPVVELQPIDFDALLPAPSPPTTSSYSPISDTLALSSRSLPRLAEPTNLSEEVVIDSGRLDQFPSAERDLPASDGTIEDLLDETNKDSYQPIEDREQSTTAKVVRSLETTFTRYQQKYQSNLKRRREMRSKDTREQSLSIPKMKFKLNSIKAAKKKTKRKLLPPPPPIVTVKQLAEEEEERPPLKITIRTSRLSADERQETRPMETECPVDPTPFEPPPPPAAEEVCQALATASNDTDLKNEIRSPSPPVETHLDLLCPSQSSSIRHSGFLIDEHTPPSSITSIEHKHSPPPLLSAQMVSEKLKSSYSHLFTADTHPDQEQNNETFTTPPPENDFHPQTQKRFSSETSYSCSPIRHKKSHQQRTSSVTSSTSSKSLSTTDYALDTEALEPVSPTPLSKSKSKHSQSSGSTASAEVSPNYYHHHSSKHSRDHHSSTKHSSSSSNRSSKPSSARSSSNHHYRSRQESPPVPPPPYPHPYHHFAPPAAFFNYPYPHPNMVPPPQYYPRHHSSKHHRQYSSRDYPPPFPYHPQQQYNGPNYMPSRDRHTFKR